MTNELTIRNMTRNEVDELVSWAANEGWNPGLDDAELFWETDPAAYIAAELDGELIGGGAITSYSGNYGFMGFFIVKPEHRSHGFGDQLWHARRERLLSRLNAGAAIGLDGVFDMQDYYAKGGFSFSHRNMRFEIKIDKAPEISTDTDRYVVPLAEISLEQITNYDLSCFPAERTDFIKRWIGQPNALALGYRQDGELKGFGVIRRCQVGCKIGPLFADNGDIAEALYARLAEFAVGGPVFLDAPENNGAAMALVEKLGMEEVFGCARMYLGHAPELDHSRIYGVTTFELG